MRNLRIMKEIFKLFAKDGESILNQIISVILSLLRKEIIITNQNSALFIYKTHKISILNRK